MNSPRTNVRVRAVVGRSVESAPDTRVRGIRLGILNRIRGTRPDDSLVMQSSLPASPTARHPRRLVLPAVPRHMCRCLGAEPRGGRSAPLDPAR